MANDSYSPLLPEQEQGGKSALVIVVVIIVLLLVGGLYAINSQRYDDENGTATTTQSGGAEFSDSTDLDDIDQDLSSLEADTSIEADITQFDQETKEL